MKTYKDLINENAGDFKDSDSLIDFLDAYVTGDKLYDCRNLEDQMHEYVDGLVPIYYHDITKEWSETGGCHGEAGEQGLIEGETDAYKIMQADLYCYYNDQLSPDYQDFIDLLDIEGLDEEDEEPTCEICGEPEDEDGRCGCTNKDGKIKD